jgi:subfamily B ATP-binding cassette protein MsbA
MVGRRAISGAMLAALTEPLMAALLKPLLDRGFTRGEMPLWFVPAAVLLLFAVRGMAQFISQYALSRIANEGMQKLRRVLFERLLSAPSWRCSRGSRPAPCRTPWSTRCRPAPCCWCRRCSACRATASR